MIPPIMIATLIGVGFVFGIPILYLLFRWKILRWKSSWSKDIPNHDQSIPTTPSQVIHIDLDPLHKAIEALPNKIMNSIVSKTNNLKGDVGEMIGYLQLNANYDRVIPLGNIVDFIALDFPKEGSPGKIVFIDIKTGKAKLSKDQLALKKLIQDKKIEFLKVTIDLTTQAGDFDGEGPK